MFEFYIPKKFCREFVQIRNGASGLLTMIMATVKGIKPCMDDWISIDKYDAYRKICKRYRLFVKPDTIFRIIDKGNIPINIIGGKYLTSTKAFGLPFNKSTQQGAVHVFISKTKKNLENCFQNGWYPLIIKNRVTSKPLIDLFKFGYNLGYPKCCINFFQRYNNWSKYSYLHEIFKNTPDNNCHYLCNPFIKDDTYSYIYHMPCSYNCQATIELAKRIRSAISGEEPEFVRKIDQCLKLPFLVFYERKAYAFEGKIKNNRLYYKSVYFIGNMPENNIYENDFKRGNCVFLEDKDIIILNKGKLVKRIKWQRKAFAPETPFIIQFN